jgi:hypothetical protein
MNLCDFFKVTIPMAVSVFLFALPSPAQPPGFSIISSNVQSDLLRFGRNIEIRNAPPGSNTGSIGLAAPVNHALVPDSTGSTRNFMIFAPLNWLSVDTRSINAAGSVAGSVSSFSATRGFISDWTGRMTLFDAPNSSFTVSMGINTRGDVSGYFFDSGSREHGFVRRQNGEMVVIDVPNSLNTTIFGINDFGDVTGFAEGHGFIRYHDGRVVVFDPPHSLLSNAVSINDGGDVTGTFVGDTAFPGTHAFARSGADGSIIVFDPPGGASTGAFSINKGGDVTGYFLSGGTNIKGFIRYRSGTIIAFDPPNSWMTFAYGINDNGDVTGSFVDLGLPPDPPFPGKVRGYVRDRSGVFKVFDAPGATYMASFSINLGDDVTGILFDANSRQLGFLRRN